MKPAESEPDMMHYKRSEKELESMKASMFHHAGLISIIQHIRHKAHHNIVMYAVNTTSRQAQPAGSSSSRV